MTSPLNPLPRHFGAACSLGGDTARARGTVVRATMLAGLVLLGIGLSSCGREDGALSTLPPIQTTTTTSSTTTTTVAQQTRFYVIQMGETLSIIAERFGVTVASIVDLNGITNPDRIEAGVTIEIPNTVRVP
jgi:LysM repeat protein